VKTQTKIAVTTALSVLFLLTSAAVAEIYWPQGVSSSTNEKTGLVYTSSNSPFVYSSTTNAVPHFSVLNQEAASENAKVGSGEEPYLLAMSLPQQGFASLAFSIRYSPLTNLSFAVALSQEGTCVYDGAMLLLKDEDSHQELLALDCSSFQADNYLDFATLLSTRGATFAPTYLELEIHAHATTPTDYRLTQLILNR
jgi:hypothetical protein